jgi:hypothetical protein
LGRVRQWLIQALADSAVLPAIPVFEDILVYQEHQVKRVPKVFEDYPVQADVAVNPVHQVIRVPIPVLKGLVVLRVNPVHPVPVDTGV